MRKFPIIQEMDEKMAEETFFVEYSIAAKGWKATGTIKYDPKEERSFWSMLQMVIESVIRDRGPENLTTIINESYTDGFSRYLRPVELDIYPMERARND